MCPVTYHVDTPKPSVIKLTGFLSQFVKVDINLTSISTGIRINHRVTEVPANSYIAVNLLKSIY